MIDLKIDMDTHYVHVEVTEDYKVVGSFDPNAPSDLDYFGYRDTEFEVKAVVAKENNAAQLPMDEEWGLIWADERIDSITLKVQDALDEMEGNVD